MTRTFLAVYPDGDTTRKVLDLLDRFRRRVSGVKWSPDHQLHFTLRFFGDLDDVELGVAREVLNGEAPELTVGRIPLNGLGAFPDWRRPRVLWIGAGAGGEELEAMARRLDLEFGRAGLGRADKPFRAHLTIGRVRDGSALSARDVEALQKEPFATAPFPVVELRLMASELSREGAKHAIIDSWPLGPGSVKS